MKYVVLYILESRECNDDTGGETLELLAMSVHTKRFSSSKQNLLNVGRQRVFASGCLVMPLFYLLVEEDIRRSAPLGCLTVFV